MGGAIGMGGEKAGRGQRQGGILLRGLKGG